MASPVGGGGSSSSGGGGGNNDGSNLTFVVTTNPYDATSAANRKQVRSIAALKSWPKRRRRTFEQYAGSAPAHQGEFIFEQQPSNDAKPDSEPAKKPTGRQPKRKRSMPVMRPEASASASASASTSAEAPLFEKCTRAATSECSCAHCRFERAISSYPSPDHPQSEPDISRSRSQKKRKSSEEGSKSTTASQDGDRRFMSPPESPTPSALGTGNIVARSESFSSFPASHHPWFDRILHPSAPDGDNPSASPAEPNDSPDPGHG